MENDRASCSKIAVLVGVDEFFNESILDGVIIEELQTTVTGACDEAWLMLYLESLAFCHASPQIRIL